MQPRSLDNLDPAGKHVLVRVDFNSPLDPVSGRILDDERIRRHLDTIEHLEDAAVVLLAHQSRPGKNDFTTLESHSERLQRLSGREVRYVDGLFGTGVRERVLDTEPGDIVLLDNARFYSEEYIEMPPEQAAETHLVEGLGPLFDAYVNDAFSAAHRSQPSLVGFPQKLPSYAGLVMERELEVLGGLDSSPEPRVYALGGAKVEDALDVVENVFDDDVADAVVTSGVLGNLLLKAEGVDLGESTEEFMREEGYLDLLSDARDLVESYPEIETPVDVAGEVGGERVEVAVDDLPFEGAAFDVGIETMVKYGGLLEDAGTAVVNGPPGVYEEPPFQRGTREIFTGAAQAELSVAGGGDTSAAISALDVHGFDHVSSGGGASTAMLSGETLPAVEALVKDGEDH